MGGSLAPYLVEAGVNKYLITYIIVFMNVGTNAYVGVPIMHSQFGDWLRLRNTKWSSKIESGRFHFMREMFGTIADALDSGLPVYMRWIVVVVYFTLNIAFGIVNMK
jgi:hypothetical protein